MPTQTEVVSKLRRSLRSAAAATFVDTDWDSFSDLLAEHEGTLPSLRPEKRRSLATRPALAFLGAFVVVLVGLGLLSVLGGPDQLAPVASDEPLSEDDSLAEEMAACNGDVSCEEGVMNSFLDQCVSEAGFNRIHKGGGIYEIEGGDAGFQASLQCFTQMSELLPPAPELTPAYLSKYYDFLLDVARCAEGQGHTVVEPPGKQAFIESQGANWHPYQNLEGGPEFEALERACPQNFRG